ncbi:MAG: hypothetical protein EA420_01130 [Candidatus Competibacteraceae bacterium]|nr:MAG: hypothetical protein EA420_01130 [Candidatus Competibacteraceae bacterium]
MKTKGCGWREVIDPADLQAMATAGMTPAQVAAYYGMSRQNLCALLKNHPELDLAFKTGLNKVMIKATRVLMSKLEKEDVLAAMFLLKCRGGWVEEQHRREKLVIDAPRPVIYLPSNGRDPAPEPETTEPV